MPITLAVNWFIGTLTNVIAYAQTLDTLNTGGVNPFVASCQDINVDNGDGKLLISADVMTVNTLNHNSSTLLSASGDPTLSEQYIPVEDMKYIELRINKYLLRGAFSDEYAMANLIAYVKGVMEKSKDIYLYQALVAEFESYAPVQASQTVTIDQYTPDINNGAEDVLATQTMNSNEIYKALVNLLTEMSAPTNKFNDITYTECVDFSRLKLVINSKYNTEMITNTLATLLNSAKITESLKWGKTFVIPKGQLAVANQDVVIGWLVDEKKIQFGYYYNVGTAFFDPATLNDKYYLHFSYYMGVAEGLPGVKIVANIIP